MGTNGVFMFRDAFCVQWSWQVRLRAERSWKAHHDMRLRCRLGWGHMRGMCVLRNVFSSIVCVVGYDVHAYLF
jgi:hypothetical protein